MVQSESVRGFHLHEPGVWALLVGILDDGVVQRDFAAVVLVQKAPNVNFLDGGHFHIREYRNVVRTICDHDHFAKSRLFTELVGILPTDVV